MVKSTQILYFLKSIETIQVKFSNTYYNNLYIFLCNVSSKYFFDIQILIVGLLVEPNTRSYQELLTKNRKVSSINVCVSNTQSPELVDFVNAGTISGLRGLYVYIIMNTNNSKNITNVSYNT